MKKIPGLLWLCLTLSVAVQAQSKEEKEVAAAVETLRKALVSADRTTLENITADELSYGHSSGKLEDKATFVDALVSGKSDFKNLDLTDQTIKVVGNTAIVRHKLSASVVDNGNPADVHLGVLLIWQKLDGQWKLLARQAYKL